MKRSLLYSDQGVIGRVGARTLYHLSLDTAVSYICADIVKRERFLKVLAQPLTTAEAIGYRRDILSDLLASSGLHGKLSSLFDRFCELRDSAALSRRNAMGLQRTGTASVSTAKSLVGINALCLKRALLFVKAMGETLSKAQLTSAGLCSLRDALTSISGASDFDKLVSRCSTFENYSTVGGVTVELVLNQDGRIVGCDKTVDAVFAEVGAPKKGFPFRRRAEESTTYVTLDPCKNGFYASLTVSALGELSRLFEELALQLFDRFCHIREELDFYEVAIRYVEVLKEKGIAPIFPELSEYGDTGFRGLRDLLLTLTFPAASLVTPHDSDARSGSILVFGDNGSGKTVFLRAVGTLQLLTQAGLPVAATEATVAVCDGVFSQFSEGEKEFCEGNRAGRFEQEVRELSEFIEDLAPRSLVLLNETFQSTSYEEGAAGLWPILRYLSANGARWLLVSHLRMLEPLAERDGVTVLHMQNGHRLVSK